MYFCSNKGSNQKNKEEWTAVGPRGYHVSHHPFSKGSEMGRGFTILKFIEAMIIGEVLT